MRTKLWFLLLLVCSDVCFASDTAAASSHDATDAPAASHDTTHDAAATVQIYRTDSMEPLNGYCPGTGMIIHTLTNSLCPCDHSVRFTVKDLAVAANLNVVLD
jgi:hypothetical protein